MVSSEGACAAHYSYGRFRDRAEPTTPAAEVHATPTPAPGPAAATTGEAA
jgi:hypothetical protein